jgi:RND family efflux transporter MFP subunit
MSDDTKQPPDDSLPQPGREQRTTRVVILAGVAILAAAVVGLYLAAQARTNHEALAQAPKPVSVVKAQATQFRPLRSYVGATASWNQANVGPQFISAYVGTVLVRPGATVKRGEVMATLDCRNASAATREIAARAKALSERQVAAEHETARVKEMKAGGFASENEAEQLQAKAASESAEVESLRAALVSRTLEVDDCILRAPFAGEVSERYVDPGAFVRPGNPVVTVVDRSTVRVIADAPESDFAVVAPGTAVAITVEANGQKLTANIARRSPAADETTRTVHFEIDVPNQDKALPVGATAQLAIEVGKPEPATLIPLRAATVRGEKAIVFTVVDGKAKRHTVTALGERGGDLFTDAKLQPGTPVVIEGRALLEDGDTVSMKELR